METWSAEEGDPFELSGDEPSTPIAIVSTQDPVPLRVSEVEDHRTPDDMVCMGTFLKDRLIARSSVPPELLADLQEHDIFASPVRLGLAAVERDPGLQCRLFALLPASQLQEQEPEEPWAASVPPYEEEAEQARPPEGAIVPILLGHVVRFRKDRKHPDDLAKEAADVLETILDDDQPLTNIVDKLLDDLLDS